MSGSLPPPTKWYRFLGVSLSIFLIVLGVYLADRGVIQSADSRWTLYLTMSLVRAGDLNMDEYGHVIATDDYRVAYLDGHLHTRYPIGTSLLITPLVYFADSLAGTVFGIDLYENMKAGPVTILTLSLELAIASVIVALTAVVVYLIGRFTLGDWKAVTLAFVFAFATSAWSTASRGLWQHGPSMLLLSLALLIVLTANNRSWMIQLLGPLLVCAYIVRPANLISIGLFVVYVFVCHRPRFLHFVMWATLAGLPFLAYNLAVYGRVLPPYYWPDGIAGNVDVGSAMLGTLFSPSRGLLVYSPVFFLAVVGAALKVRQGRFGALDAILATAILLHWLTISTWAMWWGGTSYGPRLFTDMIPFMMYFLIAVLEEMTLPQTFGAAASAFAAVLLVAISIFMHYRGATQAETWLWNRATETVGGVDQAPERVWDWSDPQFLRGIGRADMIDPARAE